MSLIKDYVQSIVRRFGYEIVRTPASSHREKDHEHGYRDAVFLLCESKEVPVLDPLSSSEYQEICPPILGQPQRVPSNFPIKAHSDLLAAVDNMSMSNYVRHEVRDGEIFLTDIYPLSHYYSRQRMLMTIYKSYFGNRLDGLSVLDIGCSSGYYCFYASALGASSVLGFDARPEHEEQFALLHATLQAATSCTYRSIDMERDFESLTETFDIVLAMGTIYHVYDHARFIQNLYRTCNKIAVIEGQCSGNSEYMCFATMEDTTISRSGLHGPVIYPSVAWVIDLMRWAGFRNVKYVELPEELDDRWGFWTFNRAMLVGEK
jgi:SAM-dependent methyltransferase